MSHHPNSNIFNRYSLPTFLENTIDITNDEIVIELGEGNYTLDYDLLFFQHNVTIKGQGRDKTILTIPKDIDYLTDDDALINLQGLFVAQPGQETDIRISVNISGLTIITNVSKAEAEAHGNDLTSHETYIIKCYNVDSFVMRDVRICAENLATTCLDICRGFNIDIRNCEFINRNRRRTGGNIWLRGDMENVIIEDNDFYKYGNDEIISLFGSNSFVGYNVSNAISKKNVDIRYNRFFCQDVNGGANPSSIITENNATWDGINQRLITFFTNQEDNKILVNNHIVQSLTPCTHTIEGIHFENNEIHINAPISHLITAAFDKNTDFKDVSFKDNTIKYGDWTVNGSNSSWKELIDFCIYFDTQYATSLIDDYDQFSEEPFVITGNTVLCGTNTRNLGTSNGVTYYQDNHIIIDINGTKVIFDNNVVKCTREAYSVDEHSFARKGVEIFHCKSKGGEVIMRNNYCEGLQCLSRLNGSSNSSIVKFKMYCSDNYLQGDTRISHSNILMSRELVVNNEIISDYPIFFLQEFANTGTAIFSGNTVYRDMSRVVDNTNPNGVIYYTGSSGSNIQSMKLICCNNIFDNVNSTSMYSYLQSNTMSTGKNGACCYRG